MKTINKRKGLAVIEAGLALAVIVPFVLAMIGVADYLQHHYHLKRLVERYAHDSGYKAHSLGVFSNSVQLRGSQEIMLASTPDSANPLNYKVSMAASLATDLASFLGCDPDTSSCQDSFYVEVRNTSLSIHPFSGELYHIRHFGEWKKTDQSSQGNHFSSSGELLLSSQYLRDEIICRASMHSSSVVMAKQSQIAICSETQLEKLTPVFSYATPSALYGVEQHQYYGPAYIAGPSASYALENDMDSGGEQKMEFLRSVSLIGVHVAIDLSGSAAGYLLKSFGISPIMSSVAIGAPRQGL